MSPTRRLAIALLCAALPSVALATPALRYSWDACDPVVVNKDFSGPDHYTQVLSATGLNGSYSFFDIVVYQGRGNPGAWLCPGSPLTWETTATGCESIPGLTLTVTYSEFLTDPTRSFIQIEGSFTEPFTADPAARYALARLVFDHTQSSAGYGKNCGGADYPQCFHVVSTRLFRADYSGEPMDWENGFVTWQDAGNKLGCPGATPTRPGTWGRLKQIYR